jgi:hypothetical protein
MSGRWFRMYDDVINDPKVMKLPEATRWHWVAVLCAASKHSGKVPPAGELAFLLRTTDQRAASLVAELLRAGLLDKVEGGFAPHNWEGRQYKSDGSTERVKRFRERQRNVSGNVTPAVSETGPEAEAEAEQKQSRAEAPRAVQVDLVEEALRADLREILGSQVDLSRCADWIAKGYDPGMVREVVREVRRRKPDVASLAYFDAALSDRHGKRALTPSERAGYEAVTDFDKVIAMFVRTGVWSRYAGPEPGMLGCRAPRELLAKHGVDAASGERVRKAS